MPRFAEHGVLESEAGVPFGLVVQDTRQAVATVTIDHVHTGVCAVAGFLESRVPDRLELAKRSQHAWSSHGACFTPCGFLALVV